MCLDFIAVEAQLTALAASLAQGSMPKLPPAWVKGDWSPGPEKYGLEVDLDVPIEMSDGVVIRALVGYPTEPTSGERASGLFPVLLEQSPYHHRPTQDGIAATVFALIARFFVARGYIYVSSQVRGTHNSGGEFGLASEREQEDGAELVEWAAHQLQGSSGRVGLTGCSYTGLNQYFTAARVGKDSPVKAIAPTGTGPDWYREPGFLGGIPTTTLEKALFEVWANTGTNSAVRFTHEVLADFKAGGPKAFDGGFWQTRSASRLIGRIVENQIPALIMAYWRDYPTSPGEAYAMFQNAFAGRDLWAPMAPDQAVTPRYQLIMGSEAHCAGRDGGAMAEATLRWFDTWLKGVDAGLEEGRPSLHLNDLDSDRWLSCGSYPPVSRYQTYYLRADGRLDSTVPAGDCESDRLCYAAPVYPGAQLAYSTAPFRNGATLAGPISATVFATSTTPEILVVADVFEISAGGEARQLATGALIGSHRSVEEAKCWRDRDGRLIRPYHPSSHESPLAPGEVVRLDIQIQPRVARLAAGHSLRLILKTQSDPAPCATVFPGGDSFWCLAPTVTQRRSLQGASFDIQRNRKWASLINVPLIFDALN